MRSVVHLHYLSFFWLRREAPYKTWERRDIDIIVRQQLLQISDEYDLVRHFAPYSLENEHSGPEPDQVYVGKVNRLENGLIVLNWAFLE